LASVDVALLTGIDLVWSEDSFAFCIVIGTGWR
jgi:hypothetical protein